MSDLHSLPSRTVPAALRATALRRALAPTPRELPRWVTDSLLVLFCGGHLCWCLARILG